jgi:hypothetical protein
VTIKVGLQVSCSNADQHNLKSNFSRKVENKKPYLLAVHVVASAFALRLYDEQVGVVHCLLEGVVTFRTLIKKQ